MGKTYAALLGLTLLLCADAAIGADASGTSATMVDFALPEYKKGNNKLQFILYGKKAVNLGAHINLVQPLLDIVKDDVQDVSEIKPLSGVSLYGLDTPFSESKKFWENIPHSQALISAGAAVYDKNTKILRGDSPVRFRSREIDIDGMGFDAYYEKKFVHIRSNVRVVIRPDVRKQTQFNSKKDKQL